MQLCLLVKCAPESGMKASGNGVCAFFAVLSLWTTLNTADSTIFRSVLRLK